MIFPNLDPLSSINYYSDSLYILIIVSIFYDSLLKIYNAATSIKNVFSINYLVVNTSYNKRIDS